MATSTISFKPKQVVRRLLSSLPDRAREVITYRYGLGKDIKRMTLDAIGKMYGITRERVRQIENYAIANIRKSEEYKQERAVFTEIETILHSLGGIVVEDDFLGHVSKDKSLQNHFYFLLVVGEPFRKIREGDEFRHRWHVNEGLAKKVEEALRKLYSNLNNQDLLPESEMISRFLGHLEDVSERYKNQEVVRRWLAISKLIGKNPLGDWGVSHSPNVKTKG